jgi:hypothetical protein
MFSKSTTCLFACALITSIPKADATYSEALEVYEKAINGSSLVKRIHEDGLERRQKEAGQLEYLLNRIADNQNVDHEPLRQGVVQALEQDKITFDALNQELKEKGYKPGVNGATYQLLTNRMPIITEAALKLATEGTLFFDILEGNLPKDYAIDPPVFNYFPESDHIYSHGIRGNALKSLLLKVWLVQNNKHYVSELGQLFGPLWLETAPFVHITPLPDNFDTSPYQSFSHYFSDRLTSKGIVTVNNGYAYGGQRDEPRYPQGKQWGPHDCSSFVAWYAKRGETFSTSHLADHFQIVNGFQFPDLGSDIVKLWEDSMPQRKADPFLQSVEQALSPLSPNPDLQTLKPGFVHAERRYKGLKKNPEVSLDGTSGHTGIFLGTIGSRDKRQALTITASRDLETTGKEFTYGVEPRPLFDEPESKVMFFDIKNRN